MFSLRQFSIGRRLIGGFAIVILLFATATTMSFYSGLRSQEAERWNVHTYRVLDAGEDMLKSMINMETGARGFLLAGDPAFLAPWTSGLAAFDVAFAQARTLTADNPQQQDRLAQMQAAHREFRGIVEGLQQARREVGQDGKTLEAFVATFAQGRDKAAMDRFRQLHADFDGAERVLLTARSAEAAKRLALTQWVLLGGSSTAIVIGLILALWLTRSITRPIQAAVEAAEAVAAGDLSRTVHTTGNDETARLLHAMRDMQHRLGGVVREIQQSAHSVATASAQLAQGNEDLSVRTEEQASALQQAAASMEQLGSTVTQNAENARTGNTLAQDASSVAARGGAVVSQVVQTMRDIDDSSRRIADIIGVIDGIAFQTNILALNAAVEAARAGEQGRGFAVVASEVRSLAQRSAGAAREIKSLINASVERVEQGTRLADQAGTTMDEVVRAIERVTHLMGEISAASTEQSAGVQQVGESVTQMDDATQQNAALVEQSSAAAESLKAQAGALAQTVNVFRLA